MRGHEGVSSGASSGATRLYALHKPCQYIVKRHIQGVAARPAWCESRLRRNLAGDPVGEDGVGAVDLGLAQIAAGGGVTS